jgi:two-component system, OmpR family, sensor histidine kinase KdpD
MDTRVQRRALDQAAAESRDVQLPSSDDPVRAATGQPGYAAGPLVVCISESPHAPHVLRRAQAIAMARHLHWIAVYVETPRYFRLPANERDRVAQTLRLAEDLGAEVVRLPGDNVADPLMDFARAHNASAVIVGKPPRSGNLRLLTRSVFQTIIDSSGSLDVYVITGEAQAPRRPTGAGPQVWRFRFWPYAISTVIVAAVGVLVWLLRAYFPAPNLSILFLTAVLISAVRWGLGVSIYTAVLSILLYDFFFVTPVVAWTSPRPQDLLALVEFLAVAVITSKLTAQVRAQVDAAKQREMRTAALYALSHQLAQAGGIEGILEAVVSQVSLILGVRSVVLLPAGHELVVRATHPRSVVLKDRDSTAAESVWRQKQDRRNDGLPLHPAEWLFLPLKTAHGSVGVLGVSFAPGRGSVFDERRLLEALAGQAAVAIERANLVQDMAQARLFAETERLRTALLSSISHDLRTPLASIKGAVSSLRNYGAAYDETIREELLKTVEDEAERLDRFVANLLSMTRLESGALRLKRSLAEPKDLIGAALTRVAGRLEQRNLVIEVDPGCPPVNVDFVLMEQVFFNVLDNAIKYSDPGSQILMQAQKQDDRVRFAVADEGIGVKKADLERIFDKFYRVNEGDAHGAGTGLGLSICRGIVDAHGGRIVAQLPAAGPGLVVTIELPIPEAADGEAFIEGTYD